MKLVDPYSKIDPAKVNVQATIKEIIYHNLDPNFTSADIAALNMITDPHEIIKRAQRSQSKVALRD